jgi:Fe-S cluster assembly protein SufD
VIARPELEIFANDVRCSHGATIGGIDPVEEFYLRSRGISPKAARDILQCAFAEEILHQMSTNDEACGSDEPTRTQ